jgi:hypothetical protein
MTIVMDEPREQRAPMLPSIVDALIAPDETAAALTAMSPGSDLVACLAVLEPERLSQAGRLDALVAFDKVAAWVTARQQELITAIADDGAARQRQRELAADARIGAAPRRFADASGNGWAAEEIACALRLAPVTAQRRIKVARMLTGPLRQALSALASGRITAPKAWALVEETRLLPEDLAIEVERAVLPAAKAQTPGEFRAAAARVARRLDERREVERHRAARDERTVVASRRPDGMGSVWALLPAEGVATLMAAVDARADRGRADDPRTADQRRSDALVEIAQLALDSMRTPPGARPGIQVTVALSTLLGCDDLPAELAGYGAISAGVARRIADDRTGTWRRLVTDPQGRLLDCGTRVYRPPHDLARHVVARDRQCTFPGCRRSAWRCDLDHLERYPDGGTCAANLHPLCRRHHLAKHSDEWSPRRESDGATVWISRTGHEYRSEPPPYPVGLDPFHDPAPDPDPDQNDGDEPPPF